MQTPYFSRDIRYKSPFGAITAGQTVTLRLFLPLDCFAAQLIWHRDGDTEQYQPLNKEPSPEGDGFWWFTRLTPERAGLYYYRFTFDTPFGHNPLQRGNGGAGVMDAALPDFQLTVYQPAPSPADAYAGGVMYQIFPDRFQNSGLPKAGVPEDRFLVPAWEGTPAFENTPEKRRINNDYWGGDLKGIQNALPYLQSLGVTCLYLNPIFEAHSNHRYNTADYTRIDPLLGNAEDFSALCRAAHDRGMRIILDGVFSHTGSDSVYFNAEGRYPANGAANRPDSPYACWYSFTEYPAKYKAWWGVPSLPEVREDEPSYLRFITGPDGVVHQWMALGADGWRLDVADELPDGFLDEFCAAVKAQNPSAPVWGEVWEDATNKYSYGIRRRYLLGGQLDSVMNYPFANAILDFVRQGDGEAFGERILTVLENYPAPAIRMLMNHVGTHDTPRLITALAGDAVEGRAAQAVTRLTPAQRQLGLLRVKLAAVLQYTLPGIPCLYYGDERGMEGYGDPFNRAPFAREPLPELEAHYSALGTLRREQPALAGTEFSLLAAQRDAVCFTRGNLTVAVNRGEQPFALPPELSGDPILGCAENGTVPPLSFAVFVK